MILGENGDDPSSFSVIGVSVPRTLLASAAVAAALLTLTACSSAADAGGTGEKTEVTVQVEGMRFVPDVVEVPAGDDLVITLENTGTEMHDLVVENGTGTEHLAPGASETFDVGVVSDDLEGWCSVGAHREMGMEMTIRAVE